MIPNDVASDLEVKDKLSYYRIAHNMGYPEYSSWLSYVCEFIMILYDMVITVI